MYYRTLLAVLTAALAHAAAASEVTPNVVLVYVDDMRLDLMGNAGHPYLETPNLDRIASEGVKYTNAYVASPLCGPSRGTLMTALLPTEHNIRNHSNVWTSQLAGVEFLPGLIKDAGASNAIIGKWHSGNFSTFLPEYDHYFLNRNSVDRDDPYFAREYNDNGTFVTLTDYNTDVMFDELSDYINEQGSMNNPYFVYTSVFSPHGPFTAAPRHAGTYVGNGVPAVPSQDFAKLPSHLSDIHERYETQAEMILAIDEGLGRMFTALEQAGTLDDTVVIFTSDNGYVFGEHGTYDKALPWQESIKVPLLVRWGNNLAAGQTSDGLVSQADLAVTIAELMGAQLPEGLYGRSLADAWTGGDVDSDRDDIVSIQYPIAGDNPQVPMWATVVSDDGWKYVAVPDPEVLNVGSLGWKYVGLESMLFNLNADPYELNNLAGDLAYAHIEGRLQQRLIEELENNFGETSWITLTFLPGDTDGDGDIDNADLANAFSNFAGPDILGKRFADGDTDGDADLDDADLATLFSNFTGPDPSDLIPGDTDGDGDIDDADIGTVFSNFSGPNIIGKFFADGDTDGDGDVDDSDLATIFTGFTGPITFEPLDGDTDSDGDIDDADLATAFSNFTGPDGAGKDVGQGDTDGDGDVDDADLANAFANFTSPIAPASVPEPGSFFVLFAGFLGMRIRRRVS